MTDDGAPVCNLPNVGQVPALQPGRMRPVIPRATDLPSLIQAINALAAIVAGLISPGTPPFRNNLAPFNAQSRNVGTPGINAGAGADGSSGAAGKDGKKGKEAKDPKWHETSRRTQNVKVENKDDEDTWVILKRTRRIEFTAQESGTKLTVDVVIENSEPKLGSPVGSDKIAAPGGGGREQIGVKTSQRTTVEENPTFPSESVNGSGIEERPFEPGLMADCVGVQWEGGLAVEFFE